MIQKIISGAQTGADRAGIAGRKASKAPGIYDRVKDIIKQILR